MEKIINTKKLRLGQVRYFDTKTNSSEIPELSVYAFLYEVNGTYVNVLDFTRDYPVFDRYIYTNYASTGEAYGNKIQLVNGELKDGLCYILERGDASRLLGKDEVTLNDLLLYVINSDKFFIDRISLLENVRGIDGFIVKRKLKEDYSKLDEFYEYVDRNADSMQYVKD